MADPSRSTGFSDPRHRLGFTGEEAAIDWFERQGWLLEAHRFRVGRNDLDLIMRRGALVAFVEVKTRLAPGFGPGREAVGWRKRQRIGRVAEVWRIRHGRAGDVYRFDLIEVRAERGGEPPVITHIPDAWRL